MDAKTLKALEGSINKWEKIEVGNGADKGITNCALCQFFLEGKDQSCENCPVAQKTKKGGCNKSPYEKWATHRNEHNVKWGPLIIDCPTCKKLAQAELRFLKSLLPKKQPTEKTINKIMEQRRKAKEKLISPKRIPK